MAKSLKLQIVKVATAIAILLAVAVALYTLHLLFIGQSWTVVQETPRAEGLEGSPGESSRLPAPQAILGLLAAALLLGGLLKRKMLIAWIGLAVLSVFAVLFLFGVGGVLLPVVGLLLGLLTIIQLRGFDQHVL